VLRRAANIEAHVISVSVCRRSVLDQILERQIICTTFFTFVLNQNHFLKSGSQKVNKGHVGLNLSTQLVVRKWSFCATWSM